MSWRTWTPNASTSAAGDVLKHVGLSAAPDAVNAQLLDNCRPLASCLQLNGASDGRAYLDEYAIIVIGAGSGGLTAAEYSAAYGVRVLLIESKLLGGDCLHTGCVPSKTLLNVAKRWKQAHETLEAYGAVESTAAASGAASETAGMSRTKDLCSRKVLERLRASRSIVSRHDSFASLSSKGVDVLFGDSVFTSANSVAVNGVTRKFKRACIATGSRPYVPPDIPGLSSVKYFTSDTFFNQDSLPARLAVVGGGPVACELAQAVAMLGSRVTLFVRGDRLLRAHPRREDVRTVQTAMEKDGVKFIFRAVVLGVRGRDRRGGGDRAAAAASGCESKTPPAGEESRGASAAAAAAVSITYSVVSPPIASASPGAAAAASANSERKAGPAEEAEFDAILIATGRVPNVGGLGLEQAGVVFSARQGVLVSDFLQTSNKRVYAVGDVCTVVSDAKGARPFHVEFTHAAGHMAGLFVKNAVFAQRARVSALLIPACTYTDPEIASVGAVPCGAHGGASRGGEEGGADAGASPAAGDSLGSCYCVEFADVDRCITDSDTHGALKVFCKKGTGVIEGVTVVGARASEMLPLVQLAMQERMDLSKFLSLVFPYPTVSDAVGQASKAHWRAHLSGTLKFVAKVISTLS